MASACVIASRVIFGNAILSSFVQLSFERDGRPMPRCISHIVCRVQPVLYNLWLR